MKDRYERRHRRTARNAACVEMMANADFEAVPSLAEAMGLEGDEKMNQVYVVRDASGEYLSGKHEGKRTPASDEAREFETQEEAQAACERTTDRVLAREVE